MAHDVLQYKSYRFGGRANLFRQGREILEKFQPTRLPPIRLEWHFEIDPPHLFQQAVGRVHPTRKGQCHMIGQYAWYATLHAFPPQNVAM